MTGRTSSNPEPSPPTLDHIESIDDICLRFEADWQANKNPRLEDYFAVGTQYERTALVRELLRLELHYRSRGGDNLEVEEYKGRFPDYQELIQKEWGHWPVAAVSAGASSTQVPAGTEGPR